MPFVLLSGGLIGKNEFLHKSQMDCGVPPLVPTNSWRLIAPNALESGGLGDEVLFREGNNPIMRFCAQSCSLTPVQAGLCAGGEANFCVSRTTVASATSTPNKVVGEAEPPQLRIVLYCHSDAGGDLGDFNGRGELQSCAAVEAFKEIDEVEQKKHHCGKGVVDGLTHIPRRHSQEVETPDQRDEAEEN